MFEEVYGKDIERYNSAHFREKKELREIPKEQTTLDLFFGSQSTLDNFYDENKSNIHFDEGRNYDY